MTGSVFYNVNRMDFSYFTEVGSSVFDYFRNKKFAKLIKENNFDTEKEVFL